MSDLAGPQHKAQLASGVMDMLLLSLLRDGESYGYEIAQALSGHGLAGVSEATVYASAKRMEKNGLLSSRREIAENGRARRYYSATEQGRNELVQRVVAWSELSGAVGSVLSIGSPPGKGQK